MIKDWFCGCSCKRFCGQSKETPFEICDMKAKSLAGLPLVFKTRKVSTWYPKEWWSYLPLICCGLYVNLFFLSSAISTPHETTFTIFLFLSRRWCTDHIIFPHTSTIPQSIPPWTHTPTRRYPLLTSTLIATARPNLARDFLTIIGERDRSRRDRQIAAKEGVTIRPVLNSVKATVNDDLPIAQ